MKNLKLGYDLAMDYNFAAQFSWNEFKYSFLHGIGFNWGTLVRLLFGLPKSTN